MEIGVSCSQALSKFRERVRMLSTRSCRTVPLAVDALIIGVDSVSVEFPDREVGARASCNPRLRYWSIQPDSSHSVLRRRSLNLRGQRRQHLIRIRSGDVLPDIVSNRDRRSFSLKFPRGRQFTDRGTSLDFLPQLDWPRSGFALTTAL